MSRKIKVLMLQDTAKVWSRWDIVEVSPSFARNVLIVKGSAKLADKQAMREYDVMQKKIKKDKEERDAKIQKMIEALKKKNLEIKRKVSDEWKLYEKVNAWDIVEAIEKKYKIKLLEKEVTLAKKIDKEWEHAYELIIEGNNVKLSLKIKKDK